jgi:hypothetical protein
MLAALTLMLLLPGPPVADDLPRSAISDRDLVKMSKDVQEFFAAMDADDRKDKVGSLSAIRKSMEKAGKRAKLTDILKHPGDWEFLLEVSKPVDRTIKAKIGKGFFAYTFVDQWSEEGTGCLLSVPPNYGKADGFLPVIIALKPAVDLSGADLLKAMTEQATVVYGSLMESTIILIPLGPDAGGRKPNPAEMSESWASDEGLSVMFMCMRVLLERMQFDRARILLDGWGEAGQDAFRVATSYPSWFAGVINRGGEVGGEDMLLENLTGVPVLYVAAGGEGRDVDTKALEERLSSYTTLTVVEHDGTATSPSSDAAASIMQWASERRRELAPTKIHYKLGDLRFQSVNWLKAMVINRRANANPGDKDFPSVDAKVDSAANRIVIETVNVTELEVYLSDAVIDLDRPVTIEVNGKEMVKGSFPRSLQKMLENRYYNNSGDYGLYPAMCLIEGIDANVPGKSP